MGNNPREILGFTNPYRVYFREMNLNQNKSLEAPFIQALQVICLFIVRMWWGRLTISA